MNVRLRELDRLAEEVAVWLVVDAGPHREEWLLVEEARVRLRKAVVLIQEDDSELSDPVQRKGEVSG